MDKWEMKVARLAGDKDHLLEDGWEPFAVTGSGTYASVWFKRKITDRRESYWRDYYKRNEKRR